MRTKYQDMKEEMIEMRRDRNTLKEEMSKLKMQIRLQQMVT